VTIIKEEKENSAPSVEIVMPQTDRVMQNPAPVTEFSRRCVISHNNCITCRTNAMQFPLLNTPLLQILFYY
jgi:hypothetical protein